MVSSLVYPVKTTTPTSVFLVVNATSMFDMGAFLKGSFGEYNEKMFRHFGYIDNNVVYGSGAPAGKGFTDYEFAELYQHIQGHYDIPNKS